MGLEIDQRDPDNFIARRDLAPAHLWFDLDADRGLWLST